MTDASSPEPRPGRDPAAAGASWPSWRPEPPWCWSRSPCPWPGCPPQLPVHAGVGGQAWILSGMGVGCAAGLRGSGALGDDHGRRRTVLIGALLLAAASLVGAAAPDALVLIVGRVLQGLGGAAIVACSLGLIGHAYRMGRSGLRRPASGARRWAPASRPARSSRWGCRRRAGGGGPSWPQRSARSRSPPRDAGGCRSRRRRARARLTCPAPCYSGSGRRRCWPGWRRAEPAGPARRRSACSAPGSCC
ncbi:MFS transporter [Dactylosporangium sp. CA-152071]|uniref:MFS transporter n=1 Tax=Dactylosporangium sp. CA-152071 TaxID=3239933 RepID=UPI003D909488